MGKNKASYYSRASASTEGDYSEYSDDYSDDYSDYSDDDYSDDGYRRSSRKSSKFARASQLEGGRRSRRGAGAGSKPPVNPIALILLGGVALGCFLWLCVTVYNFFNPKEEPTTPGSVSTSAATEPTKEYKDRPPYKDTAHDQQTLR